MYRVRLLGNYIYLVVVGVKVDRSVCGLSWAKHHWGVAEILFGVLLAAAACVAGLVLLFFGVFKKKNFLIVASLVCFLLAVIGGGITGYRVVSKSYQKASNTYRQGKRVYGAIGDAFKPRTGMDIYTALFGPQTSECVELVHYQDQLIPKIDYAIILHVKTWPDDLCEPGKDRSVYC